MSDKTRMRQKERSEIVDLKRAILVGIYSSGTEPTECLEHLNELAELARTSGFEEFEILPCPIKKLNAHTYIGTGKVEEIAIMAKQQGFDAVIFDAEISPNQQKNIEETVQVPVLDRTEVILEIFSQRAQTKEARLQIDLANSRYQLPRLKRMWTHLSRRRTGGGGGSGGGGYLRGSGEKQLEVDKRLLKERISTLEKEIKTVLHQRETQRQSRLRSEVPTFAIVGYTNAGKSTLLNAMTEAEVLTEDKLFATLDTTSRRYMLPNQMSIVLVDTVGFIRKLPHTLVAAFRSTLEEVCYTDILLHLIDVSHPQAFEHAQATMDVLKELGAKDKTIITVLNKIDLCEDKSIVQRFRIKYPRTVAISAKNREGFDHLLEVMMAELQKLRKTVKLRIPQSYYELVSEVLRDGKVISSEYEENDVLIEAEIPAKLDHKVRPFYLRETDATNTP